MFNKNTFTPKLFTTLKGYTRQQLVRDLMAGIIVGIVALPLAIAFAIASGVSPEKGLFTAVIAGFIISALGGSKVQIGGPTGAFIVIVYGIVQTYGVNGLIIATFLAGILLVIMGVARLGAVIKFIPHPLIVGFTTGIALIIFSSQVKDFLGLKMGSVPADFFQKWASYAANISSANLYAIAIAVADRGYGIPEEDLPRIFEKFYRVPRVEDAGVPGTGLGLAMVREIAELHGGTASVKSAVNQGSTFTLRLPLAEAERGDSTLEK